MVWYDFLKRDTGDPLIKIFLKTYNLNLLSLPIVDKLLSDLCIVVNNRMVTRSNIADFFEEKIELRFMTVDMLDISGKISQEVLVDIGVGFLDGFLNAFGIGNLIQKIHSDFQTKGIRSIRFSFKNPIKDYINVKKMGDELEKKKFTFSDGHPLYDKKNRYYVVTAVARTPSFSVIAIDNHGSTTEFGIEPFRIGDVDVNRSKSDSNEKMLTFEKKDPIAFGVEMHELIPNHSDQTVKIRGMEKYVGLRAVNQDVRKPIFIGDAKIGGAFLPPLPIKDK